MQIMSHNCKNDSDRMHSSAVPSGNLDLNEIYYVFENSNEQ